MNDARTWTVLELLRWTTEHFGRRGIETARLDAECLLAFALGCDRLQLYVNFDRPVEGLERERFRELVRRRAQERVPVAYLTGKREFWSLPLAVTPEVFVPRAETEILVQLALDLVPDVTAEVRVLDVGTGCGAVALALARERLNVSVVATDLCQAALAVARKNAEALGLADRVELRPGPLFEPVRGERFQLVVSNPPYVAERDADRLPPELAHEPSQALFAGADGLAVLRPLCHEVRAQLVPGGAAAFEVDPSEAATVVGWLRDAGLAEVSAHRDLSGQPRVVAARRAEGD